MPWNYLDPIQKDYWRNKVGKGSDSLESQPQAPVDPPVYIDASKITSDWYLWIHHTVDKIPDRKETKYPWQKDGRLQAFKI